MNKELNLKIQNLRKKRIFCPLYIVSNDLPLGLVDYWNRYLTSDNLNKIREISAGEYY